jgi:CheY-like chemotaxis protein
LKILLVEDNPGDVLLVREALREADLQFELLHISDGEEAVRYVRNREPRLHIPVLVLLDLNLPKCDGWEILDELRAAPDFARTPVVILSSSGAPADVSRALKFERLIYIRKPPSLDEFLSLGWRIREFLAAANAA